MSDYLLPNQAIECIAILIDDSVNFYILESLSLAHSIVGLG